MSCPRGKVAFINLHESSPAMDENAFAGDLEENGRRIFAIFKELAGSGKFELERTDEGYHLCVPRQGRKVKVMQIWPAPKDWLESRFQYIEDDVVLTVEDKKRFRFLLANVGFTPTTGGHGNMRFVFGSPEGRKIEQSVLDRLSSNLLSIHEIVQRSKLTAERGS